MKASSAKRAKSFHGTTTKVIPKRNVHVGKWWKPTKLNDGVLVWSGMNKSAAVGLYRSAHAIEDMSIRNIRFKSAGNSLWRIVAATVGQAVPVFSNALPYFVTQGTDWQPIDYSMEVDSGLALDFSWRLDKPAGKRGHIILCNGRRT